MEQERGQSELEANAEKIADVAPHAKRYLSKYARGRYAVVNFTQNVRMGSFDERGSETDGDDEATE